MINRIIDFSLDNRFLVIVLWLVAVVVGFDSLRKLPIDAVPDVTNIQVQILANSPGLGPEEVEKFITFPVETAMSGCRESSRSAPSRAFSFAAPAMRRATGSGS